MGAEELLAIIRDLALILFVCIAMLVVSITTILGLLLYRKISPILDSAKATAKQAEDLSSHIGEKVVKPLVGGSSFAFTTGQVAAFILGLSRRKGRRNNGE